MTPEPQCPRVFGDRPYHMLRRAIRNLRLDLQGHLHFGTDQTCEVGHYLFRDQPDRFASPNWIDIHGAVEALGARLGWDWPRARAGSGTRSGAWTRTWCRIRLHLRIHLLPRDLRPDHQSRTIRSERRRQSRARTKPQIPPLLLIVAFGVRESVGLPRQQADPIPHRLRDHRRILHPLQIRILGVVVRELPYFHMSCHRGIRSRSMRRRVLP